MRHRRRLGLARLLFFRLQYVGGAAIAGKEIGAVIGLEEAAEGFDAPHDQQKIVLRAGAFAEAENGIDQIMPGARLAQMDFQTIGEEGEDLLQQRRARLAEGCTGRLQIGCSGMGERPVCRTVRDELQIMQMLIGRENGKQLVDVSDVAAKLGDKVGGLSDYQVDGKTWAIPYRQDSWVLFYNKDLFAKAGVPAPDGSWTWDEYVTASEQLTTKLKAAGAKAVGDYQHLWQSTVQAFALAQTPGASLQSGDFAYLKPYYERSLALQNAGAQPKLGTVTTNKLTYQAEFGKQQAAMMVMGTWYIATLLSQQASGDADTFQWGLAPAPQFDKSTTGTSAKPVTFGDPTGLGINPNIDKSKLAAAKAFLEYAAGEQGAKALAGIGITPADTAAVTDSFFALKGMPTDDLSKFTFATHDTKPENPVSKYTAGLQNILNDLHTAVLSGSKNTDDAINQAQQRAKNEVLNK